MVDPIPAGWRSLTPYLIADGAAKAIDFYKAAFAAEERDRVSGPDAKVMHAELKVGDSIFMLADANAEWEAYPPAHFGGCPIGLYLYVTDCDAVFRRAVDAGATVKRPLADQFYGDRSGTVVDPFGYSWTIATHKKDMTSEEIAEAARQAGGG